MKAIEFLKNKGITKATCYTDSSKTYYVNELAKLMEEYAALRQPPVIGSVCDECGDGSGWYGCEDITYNCSKCNPEAK